MGHQFGENRSARQHAAFCLPEPDERYSVENRDPQKISLRNKNTRMSFALNTLQRFRSAMTGHYCDKRVSRQFEEDYYGYYGWPMYWSGSSVWGDYSHIERDRNKWGKFTKGAKTWDRHLRSTHEVTGYHLQALDGEIGHIEDFVIDDETWAIRYLIVGTKNWWPGTKGSSPI